MAPSHHMRATTSMPVHVPRCSPSRMLARQPRQDVRVYESRSGDGFLAGFVVGGVVFGALGFLFAPAISKALLGPDDRLKMPRFLDDATPKDPAQMKQDLIDKIAQLNSSIDDVTEQLKAQGKEVLTASQEEAEGIKVASS